MLRTPLLRTHINHGAMMHGDGISLTSRVPAAFQGRGRRGDGVGTVWERFRTFQRGRGRQRFLGTAWLGFGNVSETFRMYSRHNFVKV
uniref:Uncharacterized protein n=1 Tax=Brassica oleracea var. oleracea TaxID=109376 RepID=A0A0D2ZWU6_BRAOL